MSFFSFPSFPPTGNAFFPHTSATMSLSKNTSTNRGAHHTPASARTLALQLGTLIENSERDERGRIRFNPIHAVMEEGLGAPCRLDRYVSSNRGTLFQKLAKYYSRSEEELYFAKPRNGTWCVCVVHYPQSVGYAVFNHFI